MINTLAIYLAPNQVMYDIELKLVKIPEYLDRDEDIQKWAIEYIHKNYDVFNDDKDITGSNFGIFELNRKNVFGDRVRYWWHLLEKQE